MILLDPSNWERERVRSLDKRGAYVAELFTLRRLDKASLSRSASFTLAETI
jgi:hypothetical protein